MTDSNKEKGLRIKLIEELQKKGIKNRQVLDAIAVVPRHFFVSTSLQSRAYDDAPLPINCSQTISQPFTVAFQTSLLEVVPKQKILEIGTGSGYQAAILKALGAYVYSIERQRVLYNQSRILFANLSLNIATKWGDGYAGWEEFAPFDRILITCGAKTMPPSLPLQLKIGGILVAPIGEEQQVMTKIIRIAETEFETTTYGNCSFVPMLKNIHH